MSRTEPTEKICEFAKDYYEMPRLTLGLDLVTNTLQAANKLLWQRGIALKFVVVDSSDCNERQLISVKLEDDATGTKFYPSAQVLLTE